jgi:microcystin-dependent protein
MAINYPASLDTFTNPVATDPMNAATVPHATQHANLNDAVEALEAKVGADSSAVSSSHDYKLARLSTPAGMLAFTIASSAPTGWVFHNQTIANANVTYPALWAVVPASWQSGTSLVIPNLANASLMQHGVTSLGATGGANSRTIAETNLPAHTHTGTTASGGSHNHTFIAIGTTSASHTHYVDSGQPAQSGPGFVAGTTVTTSTAAAHTHTFTTGSTGGGTALDTTPLHLAVNVIIKAH